MPLKVILFDLDQTLYRRESGLQQEVGRRIQTWLCDRLGLPWDQAGVLRRDYFVRYGTTLNGLMVEKGIDAHDYLTFVHDIPVEAYLKPDRALAGMLAALPLRRVVYTNATQEYSWRVLVALGVCGCFERVIGIEDVGLRNKLYRKAYERVLALLDVQGDECIMVEDSARNLSAAKTLRITTVLVAQDGTRELIGNDDGSVDFVLGDILDVGQVVGDLVAEAEVGAPSHP
jgi:putative hydrolase of the HAD superfamily